MNPQDYIGKTFKSIMGFIIRVEDFVPDYNFGFMVGVTDAFKCRIIGNESCERAIYPIDTFDANFKPQVKMEPQPATPQQEPPLVEGERKEIP